MTAETTASEMTVDTDPSRFDLDMIHDFLSRRSYWSPGIPREVVERAIRNSLCFGLFDGDRQIGFARLITDFATFAYMADVFILEEYRGRGLGKKLVEAMMDHPRLQGLRRWMLATRDAHTLYARYGFTALAAPDRCMEKHDPNVYSRRSTP